RTVGRLRDDADDAAGAEDVLADEERQRRNPEEDPHDGVHFDRAGIDVTERAKRVHQVERDDGESEDEDGSRDRTLESSHALQKSNGYAEAFGRGADSMAASASSRRASAIETRVGMPPPRPRSATKSQPESYGAAMVIIPESCTTAIGARAWPRRRSSVLS